MNVEHVTRGIRTPFLQLALAIAGALAGITAPTSVDASSSASNCADVYDPNASYPALPSASGPDVTGEAGVVLYLHANRAVLELDGCFYVADRPLLIDFARLDFVTLLVELPDHAAGARVYVTTDDKWIETLDVSGSTFRYTLGPVHALGFEIAVPGHSAPTGPVVVSKPTGGNPKPR
jgi:hypothetical protein